MRFQRLEDLRIDADKTQEEIANILDCKREVYRRYEKGVWCLLLSRTSGVSLAVLNYLNIIRSAQIISLD